MDRQILLARAEDTADKCEKASAPAFLGFLTEEESALIAAFFGSKKIKFGFFGGFDDAARKYLACLPDWCEDTVYPITAVTFTFRECDVLSHRDFLGALMGLGISRECVGDILVEKARAVAFLSHEIAGYVLSQIKKVGSVGVKCEEGYSYPLPQFGKRVEACCTVSSLRLDNVVSAICSISRNEAAQLLEEKKVSLCGLTIQKTTKLVSSGDKISIRGKGVFYITDTESLSKKGRIILKYEKFI